MTTDKTNKNWNLTSTEAITQLSEQHAQPYEDFHLTKDSLFVIQLPKQNAGEPRKTLVINRNTQIYLVEHTPEYLFKEISQFGLLTSAVLKEAFNRIKPEKKVKFPDMSQNAIFQPLQGKKRSTVIVWINLLALSDVKTNTKGMFESIEIQMTDGSCWELAMSSRTIQRLAQKALNYYAAYSRLWLFESIDQAVWLDKKFNTSFLRSVYPKSLAKETYYDPRELYLAIMQTEAVRKEQKKIRFSNEQTKGL